MKKLACMTIFIFLFSICTGCFLKSDETNNPTDTTSKIEAKEILNKDFSSKDWESFYQSKNILICQIIDEQLFVHEITSEGDIVDTLWTSGDMPLRFPIYHHNNFLYLYAEDTLSLYDFNTHQYIDLPNSSSCFPGGFIKGETKVLYSHFYHPEKTPQVLIYDYMDSKIIKTFDGYNATVAAQDNTIFFMREEEALNHDGEMNSIILSIYSYSLGDEDPILRNTVELSDDVYDISEIVALSKDYYVYRIFDEHEYRYYEYDGQQHPFYDGGEGYRQNFNSKEQFDLVFSEEGHLAVFTERNWNELTYIVIVDLLNQERQATPYYGSFPYIKNGAIYFISDPIFVATNEQSPDFQYIQDYVVYSYCPETGILTKVIQLDNGIEIIHTQ